MQNILPKITAPLCIHIILFVFNLIGDPDVVVEGFAVEDDVKLQLLSPKWIEC